MIRTQVVVVVVGGGGGLVVVVVVGGGGGAVVVVVGRGAVVAGVDAAVVGVKAGAATTEAAGAGAAGVGVDVDLRVEPFDVVGVVFLGAVVVVVGAVDDDVVDEGGTVGGGTVDMVCSFTSCAADAAGRVGLLEPGVRRKAAPSMIAIRPRPTHMPHWRVGERSALAVADADADSG
jgi:hypothetical protein